MISIRNPFKKLSKLMKFCAEAGSMELYYNKDNNLPRKLYLQEVFDNGFLRVSSLRALVFYPDNSKIYYIKSNKNSGS